MRLLSKRERTKIKRDNASVGISLTKQRLIHVGWLGNG
jgi:hypothetical protein